jgi:hypothetical protein
MPLQASGRIKLSEIASQFGGSGPHKLSEYLRGGSNVENTSINGNIATSGANKLTNYYSTGNPRLTKIGSQDANGAMDSGRTFTLNTTDLGANTNIITISTAGGSASLGSAMTITCKNGTTDATISPSSSTAKTTNYATDGAYNNIHTFRVGNISSVKCARSGGNQNLTKYFILQYDNVPDMNTTADDYFAVGDSSRTCTLDMNSNRFACIAFQSSFGGGSGMHPGAINEVDEHSDISGNPNGTIGYDAYRASGVVNYSCSNSNSSSNDRAPRLTTGVCFDLGYN